MNIRYALHLLALGTGCFLSACNHDQETAGRLKVHMTDAPFATQLVQEANVTINKIEIRQKGKAEGSPYLTLSEAEHTLNLLELTNGITASLVDLEVPPGAYDQIRLYVDKAGVVLSDGSSYDLKVPSGAESGIKVFINPGIEVSGGLTTELLLDFDVSSSFVAQGSASSPAQVKGFNFKPTIKAANLSTAGRIAGRVSVAETGIGGAQVAVYANGELYTTTFTTADGSYVLLGLPAGNYELLVQAEGFVPSGHAHIEVKAANVTEKNIALAVQ